LITLPVPRSLLAVRRPAGPVSQCTAERSRTRQSAGADPTSTGRYSARHQTTRAQAERQWLHRLWSQRSERQVSLSPDSGANGILSLSPDSLSGLVLGGTKAGERLIPQSYNLKPSSKFKFGNRRPQLQLNGPLRSIGPWAREPVGEPEAETPPGGQAIPTGVGAHGNAATKPSLSMGPGR
jgi:hypothetical protein